MREEKQGHNRAEGNEQHNHIPQQQFALGESLMAQMDHGGDHEQDLGGEYSDHDELDERKGKHSARASLNRCQPSLLNICGGQRISAVCNLFGDKRAIFDFFSGV